MEEDIESFLEHYGVKGMKWGVRRGKDGSRPIARTLARGPMGKATKASVKAHHARQSKVSRKENRRLNKEAKDDFYSKKSSALYEEAKKQGDKTLLKIRVPGSSYPTVVTGKEFTNYLERGGVFDVKASEVFARQGSDGGAYVTNDNKIGVYKKQNFKKR